MTNPTYSIADLGKKRFDGTPVLTAYFADAYWEIIPTVGNNIPDNRALEVHWRYGRENSVCMFYATDLREVGVIFERMARDRAAWAAYIASTKVA